MNPLVFSVVIGLLFVLALDGSGSQPYVFGVAIGYIIGILHAPFYYPVKKSDPPSPSDQDPPIPPQPQH